MGDFVKYFTAWLSSNTMVSQTSTSRPERPLEFQTFWSIVTLELLLVMGRVLMLETQFRVLKHQIPENKPNFRA